MLGGGRAGGCGCRPGSCISSGMTTTGLSTNGGSGQLRCGCCGRMRPARRLTELQSTAGVYICSGCALWAARRASRAPDLRRAVRSIGHEAVGLLTAKRHGTFRSAIPVLPSADLERTTSFWRRVGFEVVGRYDGYLVTHAGGVELHFALDDGPPEGPAERSRGRAFVHVRNALASWKRLRSADVPGLGPVEELAHGLTEFVVTDPDGNRIRFGSPTETE